MTPFSPLLLKAEEAQDRTLPWLEDPLYDLLVWIHETSGLTWALSIIALTAIVRLIIMPVTVKQTRSMLAMQKLQPYVKQIQQKYKDDAQARNQAMMEFYKSNKVNPLASCLPLLLQLPIFLALFFVLKDFEAPPGTSQNFSFLFDFIPDIRKEIDSNGWRGWALIVFYVASQMLSTLVMTTSPDPKQKMMFLLLPIVFVFFIVNFPTGVMLYWITTNLWTLGQHLVVTALTNTDREIVLPPDNKGRQKTIRPKGSGGGPSKGDNGGTTGKPGGAGSKSSAGDSAARARRNKRRR